MYDLIPANVDSKYFHTSFLALGLLCLGFLCLGTSLMKQNRKNEKDWDKNAQQESDKMPIEMK
ncbi:MAG: hypothetical protein A3G87_00250 [Omnitrophica bacterium RIFCSPLOWO2_12_FULL_50_11]|nr:MAG: hypothetical protein A3G87_00250 [Omnitrophica bacterium RIFCSPLOWO2_12_FULL_50_11]